MPAPNPDFNQRTKFVLENLADYEESGSKAKSIIINSIVARFGEGSRNVKKKRRQNVRNNFGEKNTWLLTQIVKRSHNARHEVVASGIIEKLVAGVDVDETTKARLKAYAVGLLRKVKDLEESGCETLREFRDRNTNPARRDMLCDEIVDVLKRGQGTDESDDDAFIHEAADDDRIATNQSNVSLPDHEYRSLQELKDSLYDKMNPRCIKDANSRREWNQKLCELIQLLDHEEDCKPMKQNMVSNGYPTTVTPQRNDRNMVQQTSELKWLQISDHSASSSPNVMAPNNAVQITSSEPIMGTGGAFFPHPVSPSHLTPSPHTYGGSMMWMGGTPFRPFPPSHLTFDPRQQQMPVHPALYPAPCFPGCMDQSTPPPFPAPQAPLTFDPGQIPAQHPVYSPPPSPGFMTPAAPQLSPCTVPTDWTNDPFMPHPVPETQLAFDPTEQRVPMSHQHPFPPSPTPFPTQNPPQQPPMPLQCGDSSFKSDLEFDSLSSSSAGSVGVQAGALPPRQVEAVHHIKQLVQNLRHAKTPPQAATFLQDLCFYVDLPEYNHTVREVGAAAFDEVYKKFGDYDEVQRAFSNLMSHGTKL